MQAGYCTAWRAEEHRANLPIPLRAMLDNVRANRNYFRTRGGEAEMSEMWEQEGLGCARSRLRGDIKKELRAHWIAARALCGRRSRYASQEPAHCPYLLSVGDSVLADSSQGG